MPDASKLLNIAYESAEIYIRTGNDRLEEGRIAIAKDPDKADPDKAAEAFAESFKLYLEASVHAEIIEQHLNKPIKSKEELGRSPENGDQSGRPEIPQEQYDEINEGIKSIKNRLEGNSEKGLEGKFNAVNKAIAEKFAEVDLPRIYDKAELKMLKNDQPAIKDNAEKYLNNLQEGVEQARNNNAHKAEVGHCSTNPHTMAAGGYGIDEANTLQQSADQSPASGQIK